MKKRIWSILLALCLVLSLLPLSAMAAETDTRPAGGLLPQPEFTTEIIQTEPADGMQLQADDTAAVCSNIGQAANVLREAIKQRQSTVSFIYVDEAGAGLPSLHNILAVAETHTGVPTEGDYIRWQIGNGKMSSGTSDDYRFDVTVTFDSFHDTLAQEQETDAAVAQIVSTLQGKSDYEILKWIYDYLGESVTYDHDAAELPDDQVVDYTPWTAYGALVKHQAVCQGYALAFYRLALEMGIDARIVSGNNHAWIAAKLNERYYYLDPTWGGEKNFLKGSETFENHSPDSNSRIFLAYMSISPIDYTGAVIGGKCGDAVYWDLADGGVLTIHGSGSMYDYSYSWSDNHAPWDAKSVSELVIEPGVTRIGSYAFDGCRNMHTANICEGVTSIGDRAFQDVALEELNIPASVTDIGRTIITSVNLGTSSYDVLRRVNVDPANQVYKSVDGVVFSKDGTRLVLCPDGRENWYPRPGLEQRYVVPEGVTVIGSGAFSGCRFMQEIILPEGLETVENSAFSQCASLESMTVPDSVTTIGNSAFQMCGMLKTLHLGKNLTSLGSSCFAFNDNLQEVTVDPANPAYQSIDGVLFNKAGTELIQYPNSRAGDGTYVIPDGVTSFSFLRCDKLTDVTIPEGVTALETMCFGLCSGLTSVTIPQSVTRIDSMAFYSCGKLQDVYYNGTREQWDAIQIDPENNDPLLNATVHCLGPVITGQPSDVIGAVNSTATFTVAAEGEGLTYQWQVSDDDGETWTNSSVKAAKYSTKLTAAKDGRMVRCIVTDQNGISVPSAPAVMRVSTLRITTQPKDYSGKLNSTASFSVKAEGDGLTYQWQISDDSGKTWSNSSVKRAVYTSKLTAAKNGRMVRCIVSDQNGSSVTSSAATMKLSGPAITTQPKDYSGKLNSTASFSVKAVGEGLTYQWQISDDGGKTWSNSSVKAAKYTSKLTAAKNGRMVRCIVTDQNGASVTSSAATMKLSGPAITTQPKNYVGKLNSTASFSVAAAGEGLTYQWQISDDGGSTWSNSSVKRAAYTSKLTADKDGRVVRCIVTDQNGASVTSNAVSMKIG